MTSMTDFSCCSATILIQLLAAVKEMRCQKQKRCKPEQKIITSRNVLQITPLKIQLHCSSSFLSPKYFCFLIIELKHILSVQNHAPDDI